MTTTPNASAIPIRLDFDAHAPAFSRALAHLDRAAIKELEVVRIAVELRRRSPWVDGQTVTGSAIP
jgi:hypothetical protein